MFNIKHNSHDARLVMMLTDMTSYVVFLFLFICLSAIILNKVEMLIKMGKEVA